VAPLEPWEKVLVDYTSFSQTSHGDRSCVECHGGTQAATEKERAHVDLIASPSTDAQRVCGECHPAETATYPFALHSTQAGYWTAINTRSTPADHPALEGMFNNHCATCHTTCGECHVSQPENVGGGLFTGHVFEKTPPMTRSCTACHGSRIGNEFLGKNEGFPGDVHFREARMNCVKCHEGTDLHGANTDPASADTHRYAGAEAPACVNCHPDVLPGRDENPMHQTHGDTLSCQVCHAITYTSCDGCHVAISQTSGKPFFETEATYPTFLIGRNPSPTPDRPYQFVPVRHVPVAPTSYEYYGADLLSNFNALPTWLYTTPHNIQKNTPQNGSCETCHSGEASLFLTADKVKADEQAANASVILTSLPPLLETILKAPALPAPHAGFKPEACLTCHTSLPVEHETYQNCLGCHKLPK
jgi:hypothetical protein